jgi:para-aminobenzoate synthetase component 2
MLANWMASAGHPVSDRLVDELERDTRAVQLAAMA